ncbi:MAG TPA: cupredoxin domain-containing protein [Thermomicrobiales bacterium]
MEQRLTQARARLLVPAVVLALALAWLVSPSLGAQGTPEPMAGPSLPVAIHQGTCDQPVAETAFELGNAMTFGLEADEEDDEPQADEIRGTSPDVPVLRAQATIDATFDDLLDQPHLIAVHESTQAMGTIIACGNLGGVVDDGRLAVAILPTQEGGPTGVAILDEDTEGILGIGEDQVRIAVYLVSAGAAPGAAATPGATTGNVVEVGLTEFTIDMPTSLPAGRTIFRVTNNGTVEHNFEIEGQGIEEEFEDDLQPGETREMIVDLQPGTYEIYCPVDDHEDEGMRLDLTVTS